MSICQNLSSNLNILNGKIKSISGTNGNDVISLECFNRYSECHLQINDLQCSFTPKQLAQGLSIDGLKGNDKIKVFLGEDVLLNDFKLLAKEGDNTLDCKLTFPTSYGIVYLGNGTNKLYIDAQEGNNIIISGFTNVVQNTIHFTHSNDAKFSDLQIEKDQLNNKLYDISLGGESLVQMMNSYSLQDAELIIQARSLQALGKELPASFLNSGLSLDDPKDLVLHESSVFFE
jgi:hypothetical protein